MRTISHKKLQEIFREELFGHDLYLFTGINIGFDGVLNTEEPKTNDIEEVIFNQLLLSKEEIPYDMELYSWLTYGDLSFTFSVTNNRVCIEGYQNVLNLDAALDFLVKYDNSQEYKELSEQMRFRLCFEKHFDVVNSYEVELNALISKHKKRFAQWLEEKLNQSLIVFQKDFQRKLKHLRIPRSVCKKS